MGDGYLAVHFGGARPLTSGISYSDTLRNLGQPVANIIDTVERVKSVLPQIAASIPSAIKLEWQWTGP
jgi:hypothetical protein